MDAHGNVCVLMKNDFTGPLMMQPPPPSILILEEEKTAGVDWFGVGGGSQNPLINYVMEKWLSLLHVWGDWNVGMFVSSCF